MSEGKIKEAKALIWDLDNTLWDGVLVESDDVKLRPGVAELIKTLDGRGILHSIASKNNYDDAMRKLKEFKLDQYFLYPEIHWGSKSSSVANIQKNLNIGMDTLVFLDDQPFERDEVASEHPQVQVLDSLAYASDFTQLAEHPRLNPRFITKDSTRRRHMYLEDMSRRVAEDNFSGPKEEFLAGLDMSFTITRCEEVDLQRAEELTVRTHQLNATGRTYSYDELNAFRHSDDHELLVCELTDRYGSYGKIGLALVEMHPEEWWVRLLLMSCRVMSRGVGTILLSYIMQGAQQNEVRLMADFVPTDRNRMMYVSYKFAGFKETGKEKDGIVTLENDLSNIQPFPSFIKITTCGWKSKVAA